MKYIILLTLVCFLLACPPQVLAQKDYRVDGSQREDVEGSRSRNTNRSSNDRSSSTSSDDESAERAERNRQYEAIRKQVDKFWNSGEYREALRLLKQQQKMRNGPVVRENIAIAKALLAWSEATTAADYRRAMKMRPAIFTPDNVRYVEELEAKEKFARERSKREARAEQARRQEQQRSDEAKAQYELGRLASGRGDWAVAEQYFKAALQIYPAEAGYLKNVAWTQNKQGDQAWERNDFAAALALWKSALETEPGNAYAGSKVPWAQQYLEDKKQDRIVATKVQRDVSKIAEDLKNSKPTGDLDFRDLKPEGGAFGIPIAKHPVIPAPPARTGTNIQPGDQVKSAAAQAARDGDLQQNYDGGGAPGAGTLDPHTVGAGPPSLDVSTFSERARKDPELTTLMQGLANLEAKRRQLELERTQLAKELNLEKDNFRMKDLSDLALQKEKDYQTNLKAIFDQTDLAVKRRRKVDNEVEAPVPDPPKEKDETPPTDQEESRANHDA